ncbi:MAG: hypothetical protein RL205_1398 [Actinomycetota bacterium]
MTARRLLPALTLVVLVAACSASTGTAPAPSVAPSSPAASMSASPTPSASPTLEPTSPLTGLPETTPSPVLVVKLDNTHNAQPHAGLKDADVVYLEEVEYGITRIAAVFSSVIPDHIGPVRSARITDIDLLAQYGTPAFAYSGAQHKMFPVLDHASIVDVSPRTGAQGYARDHSRRAPYNYFLDGTVALGRAPDASTDHDMGFVFSPDAPAGGTVNTKAKMKWGYAKAMFTYDAMTGLYKVNLNGYPAEAAENDKGQNAATVVIQYVKQEPSKFFDKGGGNTPHAETIGTGTATVLRDGYSYDVTWSRPSATVGTTFTMADGSPMPFKPGQQWIVLLNKKTPATLYPKPVPSAVPSGTASASPSSS